MIQRLAFLSLVLGMPALALAQIDRDLARLGPSDVWCPISTTENGDPPYTNSDPVLLNQGIYELSFVATTSDLAVEMTSDAAGRLDNFLVIERETLFDAGLSFLSTNCHQGSLPEFPQARVPVFTAAAMPTEVAWSMLFDATQATLEGQGWTFENAAVDDGQSATENTQLGVEATVGAECPAAGAPACTAGTGLLVMSGTPGSEAVVTFPVTGLTPGQAYTLVAWWDFQPGTNMSVNILGPGVLAIPTLDPIGAAGLASLLAVAALVVVSRRRKLPDPG